jgi:hypothetical protein
MMMVLGMSSAVLPLLTRSTWLYGILICTYTHGIGDPGCQPLLQTSLACVRWLYIYDPGCQPLLQTSLACV